MTHPTDESPTDDRLDEVINTYLEARQSGRETDRTALLSTHPELAADLRRFFDAHDAVERMSRPLRDVAQAARVLGDDPDSVDSPDPNSSIPMEFGAYVLFEVLGAGGMGVVYRALHRSLNRHVALKQIIAGPLASESDIQRFRNEAEAAAQLEHPNIVPIYEVGEYQGRRYLTMRLIEGGNLAGHRERFRDDPRAAARLMTVVAEAVHHAHRRGFLHRDLKPSNILLDGEGQPLVTDFGLARRIGVESTLTGSGAILGSPPYMAPEQTGGRTNEITTATDVYGLGAILYVLLTGGPPFQCDTPLETIHRVRTTLPEPPRRLNPRVDRDLETICLKCLEKEPSQRYTSAESFGDDLRRWLHGHPILARRPGTLRRIVLWVRRRPYASALLATAATLFALGLLTVVWQWRTAVAAQRNMEVALYESRIALADRELSAGEPGHARELLEDCPASLRNWEWFHLRHRRRFDETKLQGGLVAMSVAYHPTASILATGIGGNAIVIWDTTDGGMKQLKTLDAHELSTTSLAFSRDGRRLVSASYDKKAKVWDTSTWQVVSVLEGEPLGGIWCAAFHPDGRQIALAGFNKSVGLWDPESGELRNLGNHTDRVTGVAFHPNGRLLASSGDDATVRLWDIDTGRELRTFRDPGLFACMCVAFSPDGRFLAAGNSGGALTLWDTASGREVFQRTRQVSPIRRMAFSPDGRRIASVGGSDGRVTIWDASSGRVLLSLHGHKPEIWGVAFRSDGEQLASAGANMVRVWDATRREELPEPGLSILRGHSEHVGAVSFSEDSRRIATASWDRTVRVWDPSDGSLVQTLTGPDGALSCVAYSPDGRLAASGRGRAVTIWDAAGKLIHTWPAHERAVTSLTFSHDGRLLASAGEDGVVNIRDAIEIGQGAGRSITSRGFIYSLAFSPDDTHLAIGSGMGVVLLYDIEGRRIAKTLRLNILIQHIKGLAYSPDGRSLAFGTESEGVQIWDSSTGQRIREIKDHDGEVFAVAYSPDGRYLASAGRTAPFESEDASTGTPVHVFSDGVGGISGLAFSPDGRYLAATNGDQTVRVWDLVRYPIPSSFREKP